MDTNIFEHISPEVLRQKNAEFLAKYSTDKKQIDYYTALAMRLWDEFEIDGSYEIEGTRKNVEVWYRNKKAQMELFRKSPYWCEEAKSIIFEIEDNKCVDFKNAIDLLDQIRCYILKHTVETQEGDKVLRAISNSFGHLSDTSDELPIITSSFIEAFCYYSRRITLTKGVERMLTKGTKITRFVRKCCEEFKINNGNVVDVTKYEDEHEPGDRTFDSFEKRYAKFADAVSSGTVKRIVLISLNFLDFMTMSNGNSWSTCHYINSNGIFHDGSGGSSYHGQYKQGCLSYALDEPSMIFYTLPVDFDGDDYYRCQKLTRMCCQYANGILITGKCYPNNQTNVIESSRSLIQKVIARAEQTDSLWTSSDNTGMIGALTQTACGSAHYQDYLKSGQHPTISLCKRHTIDFDKLMVVGHEAYCLHCGKTIGNAASGWLQCDNHRVRMVCKCCGKKIKDGERYNKINGNLYCQSCSFFCRVHNRWECATELYGTICMKDGDQQVCRDGIECLAQCVDCGVYHFKDRMLHTTNGYACKKHVRKYTKCDFCGLYVLNKDKHVTDNGSEYCKGCAATIERMSEGISTVRKEEYHVGDYVVVADDVSDDSNGVNDIMQSYYPGRIVRVVRSRCGSYGFTRVPEDHHEDGRWHWDASSIKCAIIGVDDSYIGKKLSELVR